MAAPGIIFRAQDLGFTQMAQKTCTTQSDCAVPGEGNGYCDVPTGKCWAKPVKPTPSWRTKPCVIDTLPGWRPIRSQAGVTVSIADKPIKLPPLNVAKGAQARVLTCLNGVPGGGCGGAAGAAPPIQDWGAPKQSLPTYL